MNLIRLKFEFVCVYVYIYLFGLVLVYLLNGISSFVGYLMPKPSLQKNGSGAS